MTTTVHERTGSPELRKPTSYLLLVLVVPPAVWFLDQQVSYVLVHWSCATHTNLAPPIVSAVSVVLLVATGWWAWSAFRAQPPEQSNEPGPTTERGESPRDPWQPFVLILTMVASVFFLIVVIAAAIPRFVIDPCIR